MVLTVNGVDMLPYVAKGGFKIQRSDVDAPGTTRLLNGFLKRNRVAIKSRIDITCRPLTSDEASIVLTAILPEQVKVTYFDLQTNRVLTKTMYSNNIPASFLMRRPDGTEYWSGITFPLIEY